MQVLGFRKRDSIKPLTTENSVSFKLDFKLPAESSGVWGFFDGSYPALTTDFMPEKQLEFKKFSKAAFNGLFRSCSESVKMDIKNLSEADNAAYQAWTKCDTKFQRTSGSKQLGRLMKIQCLRMEQGKAGEYITTAKTVRDELAASGAPLIEVIFLSFLLNGLLDSWESVRSNLEMQVGNILARILSRNLPRDLACSLAYEHAHSLTRGRAQGLARTLTCEHARVLNFKLS